MPKKSNLTNNNNLLKNESLNSDRFCERKSLPNNFAEKILDLEIEMDKEIINISALRQLLELYAVTLI